MTPDNFIADIRRKEASATAAADRCDAEGRPLRVAYWRTLAHILSEAARYLEGKPADGRGMTPQEIVAVREEQREGNAEAEQHGLGSDLADYCQAIAYWHGE